MPHVKEVAPIYIPTVKSLREHITENKSPRLGSYFRGSLFSSDDLFLGPHLLPSTLNNCDPFL